MTAALPDWRQAFRTADALPTTASTKEKAARGRQLERILADMFAEAQLKPRLNYRPKGEEIDGSIWYGGRTILVEAKWTNDPHPASSLYKFKGKVDGKLVGTLGLFISVGGFSADAVDALVVGKEMNLILADGDDLRAIVGNDIGVEEALEQKLRAAGDAGTPFLPLTPLTTAEERKQSQNIVVVEGRADVQYFESARRVYGTSKQVIFVPASGPVNMVPVTKLMLEVAESIKSVTVVLDGDLKRSQAERLRTEFDDLVSEYEVESKANFILVEPEVEVTLGLATADTAWRDRRHLRQLTTTKLDTLIADADLVNRATDDPALGRLLKAIGVALN